MNSSKEQTIISWQAVAKFLVWATPVVISLVALYYSHRSLQLAEKESLQVIITNNLPGTPWPYGDYPVQLTALARVSEPKADLKREEIVHVSMETYWNCLLSNTGARPLSIVDYQVWRDGEKDTERSGFYAKPGEPVSLPINLQPGESRRLILKLRIILGTKVTDLLHREDKIVNPTQSNDLFNFLFKHGMDYYGNSLSLKSLGDGRATFEIDLKNARQEKFKLRVKTSRGSYFEDNFWWYKAPMF